MSYIAIDTNIFAHLLNPAVNNDSHIDKLLGRLITLRFQLLVDSTRKIGNEYQQMIIPIIRNRDDMGLQLQLLRHWMSLDIRYQVELDPRDNLMQQIRSIIQEQDEHADRAFVYVACKQNCHLVTNDGIHILQRRSELRRNTRRRRGRNTDFISSNQAFHKLYSEEPV